MKPILEINHISKKYQIRHQLVPYLSLRDSIMERFKFKATTSSEEFWALKDVNFTVNQGDTVGIIGKNGAGKSTLLKILSKITPPTSGNIIARGRIASLLEVGTGFHAELSGRENIFLNGSILGMKRREIQAKYDEIVEFSGVEKFLDTPLKHYSSGMQLRLAFAVSAFLEPEILIIDEVLAVGDAEFQRKCLGKMDEASKIGRTVLFVSHNMASLTQLCKRSICLRQGEIVAEGKTDEVVDFYLNREGGRTGFQRSSAGENEIRFVHLYMSDTDAHERLEFKYDEDIAVQAEINLPKFSGDMQLAMRLNNRHNNPVFTIHENLEPYYVGNPDLKLAVTIPRKFITPGRYSWTVCINHPGTGLYDVHENILPFTVLDTGSEFFRYDGIDYGSVFARYSVERIAQ